MVDLWGIDEDRLNQSARLGADLGVDSLDLVELVMEVEERLNIDIPDEEVDGRVEDQTIGEVFNLVAKYSLPQAA